MNFIKENFYCWIRKKNKKNKKKIVNKNPELFCAGCFKYIENINNFSKISKIKEKYYGLCSENCYIDWLKMSGTQHLSPINDYESLLLKHDNQE